MKGLLIISGLLIVLTVQAQHKGNRLNEPWIYEAMNQGKAEVKIFVQFVMEPSGKIPDDSVKALNSFHGLEQVAIKTVVDAPDYKYTNGTKPKDKNQKFVVPITFKFENFGTKDWSEFHKMKGKKLLVNGDKNGAKREMEESIKLNKKNAESYYILGQLWADEDKTKSDKYFDQATKYGFQK